MKYIHFCHSPHKDKSEGRCSGYGMGLCGISCPRTGFVYTAIHVHVCKSLAPVLVLLLFHCLAVEEAVSNVKSLLSTSQEWEQKAKATLKQK